MINEVIGWIKKSGKQDFMLKIDFEKAYDNVNWAFLLSMLEQMRFPEKWCIWVKGILESARSSVLVNGTPTYEFQCQKGVRQGDPLSPFLFLVVMEALHCMIDRAVELEEVKGINFNNCGWSLSHLFYADDALIMCEWSEDNIKSVARVIRVFNICSGLKINIHKSHLFGIGVNMGEVEGMAGILGCQVGALPFEYLGIRVART